MNKIRKIEDIYPLTIVQMRHGKFAIINVESDCDCVSSLECDENWQYNPDHYMDELWSGINYGIGINIQHAFENYKINLNKNG